MFCKFTIYPTGTAQKTRRLLIITPSGEWFP